MRRVEKNNWRLTIYDSVDEAVRQAGNSPCGEMYRCDNGGYRSHWGNEDFVGRYFTQWSDVVKATRLLWAHGVQTVDKMAEELVRSDIPTPKDRRRRLRFNEYDGDEVDLDRLRAGQPFWRCSARETVDGPVTINVFVDTTTPCDEDHSNILWRGAAGIALAIVMESVGYRVRLWCVQGSEGYHDKRQFTGTLLKEADQPLDKSTLANAVSGWFYRTVTFRNIDVNALGLQVQMGYGSCVIPTAEILAEMSDQDNDIFVSGVYSYTGALDVVRDELFQLVKKQEEAR